MTTTTHDGPRLEYGEPELAPAAVSAVDVIRRYGDDGSGVDALAGVSIDVPVGQFTAVMGPSGSGKSTLMHILAGLDQPTEGTVMIAGPAVSSSESRSPRARPRPTVVFADEPTGNLDSTTPQDLLGLLRNSVDGLASTDGAHSQRSPRTTRVPRSRATRRTGPNPCCGRCE